MLSLIKKLKKWYVQEMITLLQEKILEEQKIIFGKQVCDKDVEVTFGTLQEMKYLEMVIKETMRLYPSIPIIARKLMSDIKLGNTGY